jgi:hypothetical protein
MIADIAVDAAPSRLSATTVRSAGSAVATSSTGLEGRPRAHKSVGPAVAIKELGEAASVGGLFHFRECRLLCRFLDAGMTNLPRAVAAGVQKAPRHEVAGSLALVVLRALWGFDSGAGLEGGCNTDRMRPADQPTVEIGSV